MEHKLHVLPLGEQAEKDAQSAGGDVVDGRQVVLGGELVEHHDEGLAGLLGRKGPLAPVEPARQDQEII